MRIETVIISDLKKRYNVRTKEMKIKKRNEIK